MQNSHQTELRYELNTDLPLVYNSLLDLKKFGALHPHMRSVEIIDTQPDFTQYTIKEEILFLGFIKNYPVYSAKVFEIQKNKHIRYTSQVKPFIFLTIDFVLDENKHGVIITENITLQCKKLIAIVFSGILKKAHTAVFENIEKLRKA